VGDDESDSPSSAVRNIPRNERGAANGSAQAPGLNDVEGSEQSASQLEEQRAPAGSAQSPRDLVVVGSLHAKRLVALPFLPLRDAARRNERKQLPVAVLSEVVGSPVAVQSMGDSLIVATTNVRTLVKVPKLLVGKPTELKISDVIGSGDSILDFGSLMPLADDRLLVSVGYETKTALVEVRASTFEVVRTQVFDDRYSGLPLLCSPRNSDRIVLVTAEHVDILDAASLRRVATAKEVGKPAGLACVNERAWVSDFFTGTGRIYNMSGEATGSFTWTGEGTSYLLFVPEAQSVFGADSGSGTVFSCPLTGGICKSSQRIGRKPTDLLFLDGSLMVTLESEQQIAALKPDLQLEGTAAFPDLPRTLTRVRA
jgi:hypothetical protein